MEVECGAKALSMSEDLLQPALSLLIAEAVHVLYVMDLKMTLAVP
jgi:hypothetical protein